MKKPKLTQSVAEALAPRSKRYVEWCGALPCFGLRISPTGHKTWIVKYREDGGGRSAQPRWPTLGTFPSVSAEEARKRAKNKLASNQLGLDPAADRRARQKEMTVSAMIDFYEQEGCVVQRGTRQGEPMKPTTKAYTLGRLRHHVVPLLGKKRASEITEGDIEMFSRAVSQGKTARDDRVTDPVSGKSKRVIVSGGEGAARKVVRDLSAVFSFALRHRIVQFNPVQNARVRKVDNRRNRFLSLSEVEQFGAALEALEDDGVNPKALNISRAWLLTGCRRNEIAGLRKTEIDLDNRRLVLSDSKTGKSFRPLGEAAVALFASLLAKPGEPSEYVFPAERGAGFFQGTKTVWPKIKQRAGLADITPHTMRHTVGSAAASAGESMLMISAILGQANARSTAIYAHVADASANSAAERTLAPLAAALARHA